MPLGALQTLPPSLLLLSSCLKKFYRCPFSRFFKLPIKSEQKHFYSVDGLCNLLPNFSVKHLKASWELCPLKHLPLCESLYLILQLRIFGVSLLDRQDQSFQEQWRNRDCREGCRSQVSWRTRVETGSSRHDSVVGYATEKMLKHRFKPIETRCLGSKCIIEPFSE